MNDICERKHGGVFTSRKAFERIQPNLPKARSEVLLAISLTLDKGMTAKEYSKLTGKPLHAVSPRFKELRDDGWIEHRGEVRDGSKVHCATT